MNDPGESENKVIAPFHASARDYVSPNLAIISPDKFFPNMIPANPRLSTWRYLRRDVPHIWYADRRFPHVGFINRDEAMIVYNTALQFKGKRALEIGCFMGWSACHLALAGVQVDVIDPLLGKNDWRAGVAESLRAAGVLESVHLCEGQSPEKVREIADRERRRWPLIFIDGNHEGMAPLHDAVVCEQYAQADALILFHDLNSPDVGRALDYLRGRGWQTMIYQTMQIVGVAWRGNVQPILHRPDPKVAWDLPPHLQNHVVSLDHQLMLADAHQTFFANLIEKTQNFSQVTWMGQPIWQNVLDLWTIQESVAEVKPQLIVECGTHRGPAALFYAHLCELLGTGRVLSVDTQTTHSISHPRVTYLQGSSVAEEVLQQVRAAVASTIGPVMVILDSDHSQAHVTWELEAYAPFVSPGSFLLVQDGVIDVLPMFRGFRPGPLPAIRDFLDRHCSEFEVDTIRSERFLISHHPLGWLRRKATMNARASELTKRISLR